MMYRLLLKPLLFLLPAETAHHLGMAALRLLQACPWLCQLLWRWRWRHLGMAPVNVFGHTLPHPVGLAAGFDKDARAFNALAAIGFAFVEVGTLTAEAQPGNDKPRLFRLPSDEALINRLGFNNHGAAAAAQRLKQPRFSMVGVNIGKTRRVDASQTIADYQRSTETLAPLADYLVVNVSSPNTPGLRDLQAIESLRPLLQAVRATADGCVPERRVPLLLKIAPDLSDEDVDAIAHLALELRLEGLIATNTTVARTALGSPAHRVAACGAGGLSGRPLKQRSLQVLRRLRAITGDALVLVAAGGIESAADVQASLAAGATLVQVYTAFVYQGPALLGRLNRPST